MKIINIKKNSDSLKVKFLGISVFSKKIKECKEVWRLLNIPVIKIISLGMKKKYYFLGIKIYKKIETISWTEKEYIYSETTDNKELLIVNSDSIGDYILFRNFLKEVKKSKKYQGYKLVLLGCEKYRKFAEYLDSDIVDTFLWMPAMPQKKSFNELSAIKNDLYSNQGLKNYYDTIIFSSFNSCFKRWAHEFLISETAYREKIIFCDKMDSSRDSSDMLSYTHIYMNYNAKYMFDFDLNKAFFEDLLDQKINLQYPKIEDNKINFTCDWLKEQKKEYIVINPCAFHKFRMWHEFNWIQVIKHLKKLNYDIFIVCGNNEKDYCSKMINESGENDIKLLSGLPVEQLLAVLKLAKMYIGQDSGVFHIAAALNIRSICLSAGNAYFRFVNYPKTRRNVKVIFPVGTEEWILENKDIYHTLVDTNCFLINQLRPDKVIEAAEELLLRKEIVFIHKLKTKNTGDQEICPYDYFKDYFDQYIVQKFDNDDLKYLSFKKAIFILGGGGLINQNDNWNNWTNKLIENKNKVIGWGLGFNQHYDRPVKAQMKLSEFSLLGIRDYNVKQPYLPCVSCLRINNTVSKIVRKIGCIIHYENTKNPFDFPTIYNNQSFEEIINFIKETEVIITNTYHAMYWSTLMNKKVILYNPFSNKFDNFKYKPVIYSGNLKSDINKAVVYSQSLEECQSENRVFFEKVKKIIEE